MERQDTQTGHTVHPLLAMLAEAVFVLHGWLRSGNTGPARGVVAFLQEALALLPECTWIRSVRADSGFFDQSLLEFLEARALPYVIVARLTSILKRRCTGIGDWTSIDEHYAVGEFTAQLFGWSKERRFVVVRERVRETKAAVGRAGLHVSPLGHQPPGQRTGAVAGLQPAGMHRTAD